MRWTCAALVALIGAACSSRAAQEQCDIKWYVRNVDCPEGSAPQFRVSGSDSVSLKASTDTVDGSYLTHAGCEFACVWAPGAGGETGGA